MYHRLMTNYCRVISSMVIYILCQELGSELFLQIYIYIYCHIGMLITPDFIIMLSFLEFELV